MATSTKTFTMTRTGYRTGEGYIRRSDKTLSHFTDTEWKVDQTGIGITGAEGALRGHAIRIAWPNNSDYVYIRGLPKNNIISIKLQITVTGSNTYEQEYYYGLAKKGGSGAQLEAETQRTYTLQPEDSRVIEVMLDYDYINSDFCFGGGGGPGTENLKVAENAVRVIVEYRTSIQVSLYTNNSQLTGQYYRFSDGTTNKTIDTDTTELSINTSLIQPWYTYNNTSVSPSGSASFNSSTNKITISNFSQDISITFTIAPAKRIRAQVMASYNGIDWTLVYGNASESDNINKLKTGNLYGTYFAVDTTIGGGSGPREQIYIPYAGEGYEFVGWEWYEENGQSFHSDNTNLTIRDTDQAHVIYQQNSYGFVVAKFLATRSQLRPRIKTYHGNSDPVIYSAAESQYNSSHKYYRDYFNTGHYLHVPSVLASATWNSESSNYHPFSSSLLMPYELGYDVSNQHLYIGAASTSDRPQLIGTACDLIWEAGQPGCYVYNSASGWFTVTSESTYANGNYYCDMQPYTQIGVAYKADSNRYSDIYIYANVDMTAKINDDLIHILPHVNRIDWASTGGSSQWAPLVRIWGIR